MKKMAATLSPTLSLLCSTKSVLLSETSDNVGLVHDVHVELASSCSCLLDSDRAYEIHPKPLQNTRKADTALRKDFQIRG